MNRAIELLHAGLGAALLPCALVLLVPGVSVALTARKESTPAVGGFVLAAWLGSWLFLSGRVGMPSDALVTLALAASVFLLVIPFVRRLDVVSALGGALAGGAAAALWLPCPGPELGQLLLELPSRGGSGAAYLAVYLVGLMAPLFFITAILHLLPSGILLPARPLMLVVGASVLGLLALLVAIGVHDDLIARLADWSV